MMAELIGMSIMIPWLFFDVYFLVMSIALLFFGGRSINKTANLKPLSKYNDQSIILIPIYNNSRTILNELLPQIEKWFSNQLDLPISVVLVDSSTDGTEKKILSAINAVWDVDTSDMCIAHKRNLTLTHLKNRSGGKSWAINKVALNSNAKYFAILDSDWIISFEELGRAIHYLANNKQYAYAQLAWRATDKPMNFVAGLDQVSIEYRHQFENRVRIWKDIPVTIHGSAVVINTQDFCKIGGFRENVLSEDVDLALRFMLSGKFGAGICCLTMQQHPCDHISQFFWQKARWAEGRSQMLKKYLLQIVSSKYFTFKQKVVWIYYLAYFGRCVAFLVLLVLMVAGFIVKDHALAVSCSAVILLCLVLRMLSHFVTMAHRINKVPFVCRLIEPFTFYGIGLIYGYTFFKGLFSSKGVWRVVESKTYT